MNIISKQLNLFCFTGTVDAANNLRDNLPSYHDIIGTERWEMRFFGFFLGLCEANAFSAYRKYAAEGDSTLHASFKDKLAFGMLQHCENLLKTSNIEASIGRSSLRSSSIHDHIPLPRTSKGKRRRMVCNRCKETTSKAVRVGKCCSCNPEHPLCDDCYMEHLKNVWQHQR